NERVLISTTACRGTARTVRGVPIWADSTTVDPGRRSRGLFSGFLGSRAGASGVTSTIHVAILDAASTTGSAERKRAPRFSRSKRSPLGSLTLAGLALVNE